MKLVIDTSLMGDAGAEFEYQLIQHVAKMMREIALDEFAEARRIAKQYPDDAEEARERGRAARAREVVVPEAGRRQIQGVGLRGAEVRGQHRRGYAMQVETRTPDPRSGTAILMVSAPRRGTGTRLDGPKLQDREGGARVPGGPPGGGHQVCPGSRCNGPYGAKPPGWGKDTPDGSMGAPEHDFGCAYGGCEGGVMGDPGTDPEAQVWRDALPVVPADAVYLIVAAVAWYEHPSPSNEQDLRSAVARWIDYRDRGLTTTRVKQREEK